MEVSYSIEETYAGKAFYLKYNNRALRDNSEAENELKIIVDNVLNVLCIINV